MLHDTIAEVPMKQLMFCLVMLATTPAAASCHLYSTWKYPFPQRCPVRFVQTPPLPPKNPCVAFPEMCFLKDIAPERDIPLPSLEGMEFPPDASGPEWERLKGIGLLRELRGTN